MRINTTPIARFAGLLFLFVLPVWAFSQPRFKAAVVAGLTASQIDGDLSAGYHKLGVQGGLRGIARLQPRQDLSIEFLYSQRGCKSTLLKDQFDPYRFSHTLNYVEVPVLWNYKDWLIEGEDDADDFYRVAFNIGLSYARLISASSKGEGSGIGAVLEPEILLKKSDVSFLVGANFMASQHLGFTFRYVRSFGRMYNPSNFDPAPYPYTLNGHCLYFQTFYLF